jgi:hypothetical protein
MKFLKFAAAVAFLGLPSLAIADSVALCAGTFDPPGRAQIAVLRCALGDPRLAEICQAIGKTISRLVVLVNESSKEDPLASSRERILMVRKALREYGERVEVSASPAAEMDAKRRALLAGNNIFIGQDSFDQLKSSPDSHNPKLAWTVFSLEDEAMPRRPVDTRSFTPTVRVALEIGGFEGSSPAKLQSAIWAGTATARWIDPDETNAQPA